MINYDAANNTEADDQGESTTMDEYPSYGALRVPTHMGVVLIHRLALSPWSNVGVLLHPYRHVSCFGPTSFKGPPCFKGPPVRWQR